ncbi:MAG: hypothetical protein WBO95_16950 [Candidatus Dechloromonas phosphoritropha]
MFESTHVSWAFWCKLERAIPSFMVAICILAGTAFSAHAGIHKELRFAKGGSSVTVDAAVIRGEADRYLIGAMKGQYLSIKIQAEEDNAVFDVLHPGANDTNEFGIEGTVLANAVALKSTIIQLPVGGKYMIVVSGTRGNAHYRM